MRRLQPNGAGSHFISCTIRNATVFWHRALSAVSYQARVDRRQQDATPGKIKFRRRKLKRIFARSFHVVIRAQRCQFYAYSKHRLKYKIICNCNNRARQLYKHISMLFLFPVKDGRLVQASMQLLMHHVTVSLQQCKITLQNICINNTSITQPTLSF